MNKPMTPQYCDLRDFPYVPIDINRLFGSSFHARANDAEWRAGFTLWLKSWHQVPAGSLPIDDVDLCRLAELGRDLKTWQKVKVRALHGWVECSDGRLYHPVVSEKALQAWEKRESYRNRARKGNEKRWNGLDKHAEQKGMQGENSSGKDSTGNEYSSVQQATKSESPSESPSDPSAIAQGIATPSLRFPKYKCKGEGEGEAKQQRGVRGEEGAGEPAVENLAAAADLPPIPLDPIAYRAIEIASTMTRRGAALQASDPRVRRWAETGVSDAQALTALEIANQRRADRADPKPVNAGLLDAILADLTRPAGNPPNGRKRSIHDERAETIAALTGKSIINKMKGERDVTADSIRIS